MKRVLPALLVLWIVLLPACPAGLAPGSGILSVSCTDNGSSTTIKQLYYSIDGGPQNVLGEGDMMQHWLQVGDHRMSGYFAIWSWGVLPTPYYFDETVYVWDAEYGETTWGK
jgi:hypothetical protein